MKRTAKSVARQLGVYERVSRGWIWAEPRLIRAARAVTGRNRSLAGRYLAGYSTAKLHVGCGDNHLSGWLNTELCPGPEEMFLDATRPFPLPGNAFAFVYSEHMIEHVAYHEAQAMLRESFRILRPGGIIRIVTPNLAFLTTLLQANLSAAQLAYIDYSFDAYKVDGPRGSGIHVFNHFTRAWGHQFIYDQGSLERAIADAGFDEVTACALSDSRHPELRDLAIVDRMPRPFLAMESVAVEGRKPS